jgi:chloramphenicol 3-O phosphotransferase
MGYSDSPRPGTVVVLNGVSCSGKSSVARAVQEVMAEPWMHCGLDHFEAMQPRKEGKRIHCFYGQGIEQPDLVPALHQAVAALSRMGAHVVNEHILLQPRWLADAVERYRGLPVVFVGVVCPLEELERRERERNKGVQIGQSARQFERLRYLHEAGVYDLALDTTTLTPGECAEEIGRLLKEGTVAGFGRVTRELMES